MYAIHHTNLFTHKTPETSRAVCSTQPMAMETRLGSSKIKTNESNYLKQSPKGGSKKIKWAGILIRPILLPGARQAVLSNHRNGKALGGGISVKFFSLRSCFILLHNFHYNFIKRPDSFD